MKVNVYDLAYLVAKKTHAEFDGVSERIAMLIGPNKYITVDMDCNFEIHTKDGFIVLIDHRSSEEIQYTFEEIAKSNPIDEVELGTFVRIYDTRTEVQYSKLLEAIRWIGLDSRNYPRVPK